MKMEVYALAVVFFFAFIICSFSSIASAMSVQGDTFGDVNIDRIYPESAYIGQKIWITIAIENAGTSDKTITITDKLGDAEFNKSAATSVNTTYGTMYLYEWEISLPAGENTSVSYWIEPKSSGNYVISPSEVSIAGTKYRLKSAAIAVQCSVDSTCASGENYLNCPQDCSSGAQDGVCDEVADSKCDMDCATGADSDCTVQNITGGNGTATTNITQDITTNLTANGTGATSSVTERKETGGFDLASLAPYALVIAVIAVAAIWFMRRKK